jgi:CRP-like cAMP-binding protein
MVKTFRQYITQTGSFTEQELETITAAAISRQVRKRQFVLQEGEVSVSMNFILKGCLRMYRIDANGHEHILTFGIENWWISDKESYLTGNPSKYNSDAIEDCQILMWHKEDFRLLIQQVPAFYLSIQKMVADSNITLSNRLYETLSYSAEEEYHNFIKTYPDIFNRVPLHMIASYLGVTRETLSRVRNQFAYK